VDDYKANVDGKGIGAFTIDGKMIDMPIVKAAIKVLAAAGINS
jgi:citrate lyase beta subunit